MTGAKQVQYFTMPFSLGGLIIKLMCPSLSLFHQLWFTQPETVTIYNKLWGQMQKCRCFSVGKSNGFWLVVDSLLLVRSAAHGRLTAAYTKLLMQLLKKGGCTFALLQETEKKIWEAVCLSNKQCKSEIKVVLKYSDDLTGCYCYTSSVLNDYYNFVSYAVHRSLSFVFHLNNFTELVTFILVFVFSVCVFCFVFCFLFWGGRGALSLISGCLQEKQCLLMPRDLFILLQSYPKSVKYKTV